MVGSCGHIGDTSHLWNRNPTDVLVHPPYFLVVRNVMKILSLSAASLLATTVNFASPTVQAAESVTPEPYHYGMRLDIGKVVTLHEEPSTHCQVVDARMDYLDSNGQLRSLAYRKLADTCTNQN